MQAVQEIFDEKREFNGILIKIMDVQYNKQVFQAFKEDHKRINPIMTKLEEGKLDTLRGLMEDSIDDLVQDIIQILGEGEISIHNAKVSTYHEREICYSLLMDNIISKLNQEIPNEKAKLHRS